MPNVVTTSIQDEIAVIRIDNPPVNALSPEVIDGLAAAVSAAQQDPAVRALVVVGAGRTFIAGADIKGLEAMAWGGDGGVPVMHDTLGLIEDGPKPVVMALHGTALGGGLEVAMAGHYRVAVADAQMGQPEVNLGIIPGAEGTQRLPRLVGVEKAIEMCVTGKPVKAADALAAGLIDRIIEGDLTAGAVAFAREVSRGLTEDPRATRQAAARRGAAGPPAGRTRPRPQDPAQHGSAARGRRRHRGGGDAALRRRLRPRAWHLQRLRQVRPVQGADLRVLRRARRLEGAGRHRRDTPVSPINTVAIVGAGTMGGGIAMACANAGLKVVMIDAASAALDAGMARIKSNYETSVKRGRFTPEAVQERLGRIRSQVGYGGVDSADLVIEAVFENLALKKQIFGELDVLARPDAILATNTSTLDIDADRGGDQRPAQVIGLHFFSPANVMRLLEIVRGAATSVETIATALALAKRLGKVGVVVGNAPGFVGNRMMFPYMYEAQFLVEEGATPEQVDKALTDFGMAMGIFAVDDMAGLDVAWRVRQELNQFSEPGARRPLVADRAVRDGPLRPEDRRRLVSLRRGPQAASRSRGDRASSNSRRRPRGSRVARSPATRSSSARFTR